MIVLSRHPNGESLHVAPAAIAMYTRVDGENFTELVLCIQGPRDTGPLCYRVIESPEMIYQKWADGRNADLDSRLRGLHSVISG